MTRNTWMIYGAYGYTGRLIAAEAVRRGHRPILAGRSAQKLAPLAEHLGLEQRVFSLEDRPALYKNVAAVDLVLHAAGPFIHTSAAMVRACLEGEAHYLDITGEVPVFAAVLSLDQEARRRGVALIPGAGFDVLPSDCLANYVAAKVANPSYLEIALASMGKTSQGTAKTALEHAHTGILARRGGRLISLPPGKGARRVRFIHHERRVVPFTWGDLVSAYHSTGIPNITTYMAVSPGSILFLRCWGPLVLRLLRLRAVRAVARRAIEMVIRDSEADSAPGKGAFLWAQATNERGEQAGAWLEVPEAYRFTAQASVHTLERVLQGGAVGALTPAQAFGADFVLEIAGTRRLDQVQIPKGGLR